MKCAMGRADVRVSRAAATLLMLAVLTPWLPAAPKPRISITNSPPSTANWKLGPYGEANLTGGPGSDLLPSRESTPSFVTIDINAGSLVTWKVAVRRTDTVWKAGLHLFVRRTADGTGLGTVAGGAAYQEVTTGEVLFFSGSDDRSGIAVQLRLDGVSVVLGPGAFSTTVTYTVTEP